MPRPSKGCDYCTLVRKVHPGAKVICEYERRTVYDKPCTNCLRFQWKQQSMPLMCTQLSMERKEGEEISRKPVRKVDHFSSLHNPSIVLTVEEIKGAINDMFKVRSKSSIMSNLDAESLQDQFDDVGDISIERQVPFIRNERDDMAMASGSKHSYKRSRYISPSAALPERSVVPRSSMMLLDNVLSTENALARDTSMLAAHSYRSNSDTPALFSTSEQTSNTNILVSRSNEEANGIVQAPVEVPHGAIRYPELKKAKELHNDYNFHFCSADQLRTRFGPDTEEAKDIAPPEGFYQLEDPIKIEDDKSNSTDDEEKRKEKHSRRIRRERWRQSNPRLDRFLREEVKGQTLRCNRVQQADIRLLVLDVPKGVYTAAIMVELFEPKDPIDEDIQRKPVAPVGLSLRVGKPRRYEANDKDRFKKIFEGLREDDLFHSWWRKLLIKTERRKDLFDNIDQDPYDVKPGLVIDPSTWDRYENKGWFLARSVDSIIEMDESGHLLFMLHNYAPAWHGGFKIAAVGLLKVDRGLTS